MKCFALLLVIFLLIGCATPQRQTSPPIARPSAARPAPAPPVVSESGRWMDAEISFYCACKKCCGPNAQGITASGARATVGVTCSAPRTIPFGTRIRIPSMGWRTVQDRASPKFDHRIDVFVADHAEAIKLGIRKERVWIEAE